MILKLINVKCLEVPFICSPLAQGQAIDWMKKNYPQLDGLALAGDSTELENLEVHILLGAGFLWHIMMGEIQQEKDENEPVVIGTHFGYVLSGPVSNMPPTQLSRVHFSCTHVLRMSTAQCEAQVIVNCEESSSQQKLNQMFGLNILGIFKSDSVNEKLL